MSLENMRGKLPRPEQVGDFNMAARIFFDTASEKTCTVFDAKYQPICRRWDMLDAKTQSETVYGLTTRVKNEGLREYLERKRPTVGNDITDEIYRRLKSAGLLNK